MGKGGARWMAFLTKGGPTDTASVVMK
jgi:hypothetical protein